MCSVQFSESLLLSELDEAAVGIISHPEVALQITGNSYTTAELARECVNKSMVRTEDPQTATTTLTDGNVACSIDGNAYRTVDSTSSIAGELFPCGVKTLMQLELLAAA